MESQGGVTIDSTDGPIISCPYPPQPQAKRRKSSPPVRIVRPAKFDDDRHDDHNNDSSDDEGNLCIDEDVTNDNDKRSTVHHRGNNANYPLQQWPNYPDQKNGCDTIHHYPTTAAPPGGLNVIRPKAEKIQAIKPYQYEQNTNNADPMSMLRTMIDRIPQSETEPTTAQPIRTEPSKLDNEQTTSSNNQPSVVMPTSAFTRVLPKTESTPMTPVGGGGAADDSRVPGFKQAEDSTMMMNMNLMQNAGMMLQNPMMLAAAAAMNPLLAHLQQQQQQNPLLPSPAVMNQQQMFAAQQMWMLQMQMMMQQNPFNGMWPQQFGFPQTGGSTAGYPMLAMNANAPTETKATKNGKKTTYPCMYCSKIIKGQKRFDAHVKLHQKKHYDSQREQQGAPPAAMSNGFMSHMFSGTSGAQFPPLSPIPNAKFPMASTPIISPSPLIDAMTTKHATPTMNPALMLPNGHSSPRTEAKRKHPDDVAAAPSSGGEILDLSDKKMEISPVDSHDAKVKIEINDNATYKAAMKLDMDAKQKPFSDSSDSIHSSPESKNSVGDSVNRPSLSSSSNSSGDHHQGATSNEEDSAAAARRLPQFTGETTCSFCGVTLESADVYNAHMQQHLNERNYKCSFCHLVFAKSAARKQHERIHTPRSASSSSSELFQCAYCPKTFVQRTTLRHHTRTHTGEKPYKCPYCDMSFAHHKSRVHHIRTHTGERPYACNICQARFAQSGNLHRHMRIHEVNRGTTCNFCLQGFKAVATLERHLQAHVDNYNPSMGAQCGLCEERFTELRALNEHIATHRSMSHQCEHCDEKFHSQYLLTRHVRSAHRYGDEYPCEDCGKIFTNRGPLEIHRRWHQRRNNAAANNASPPSNAQSPPSNNNNNNIDSSSLSPLTPPSGERMSLNSMTDDDEELDVDGGFDDTDVINGYHGDESNCQNDSLLLQSAVECR
ncbi:uncharacterized protein LOC141914162 [Tubulanus polymorphus]|uniref:uncharacterized protein LOC141914162 n=1 Tax=Tubulanus polymorphus TaxID=672921 RepID=UPI003DA50447